MDSTLMITKQANKRKGQALVETMLFFFPLMMICFYGFANLHEEYLQEFTNIRVLRMRMIRKQVDGPHDHSGINERYLEHLVSEHRSDELPEYHPSAPRQHTDKFPSRGMLNYQKLLELPEWAFEKLYQPSTLTLTFDYEVDNNLTNNALYKKQKTYRASTLQAGSIRYRGRAVGVMLGIGAGFFK